MQVYWVTVVCFLCTIVDIQELLQNTSHKIRVYKTTVAENAQRSPVHYDQGNKCHWRRGHFHLGIKTMPATDKVCGNK